MKVVRCECGNYYDLYKDSVCPKCGSDEYTTTGEKTAGVIMEDKKAIRKHEKEKRAEEKRLKKEQKQKAKEKKGKKGEYSAGKAEEDTSGKKSSKQDDEVNADSKEKGWNINDMPDGGFIDHADYTPKNKQSQETVDTRKLDDATVGEEYTEDDTTRRLKESSGDTVGEDSVADCSTIKLEEIDDINRQKTDPVTIPVFEDGHIEIYPDVDSKRDDLILPLEEDDDVPTKYFEEDDDTPTIYHFEPETSEVEPVVGWLVCIQGNNKGSSYILKTGVNNIGRGSDMDVVLKGDNYISRNKHAVIVYKPEERGFFIEPSEGQAKTYINEKLLMSYQKLMEGDVIRLGVGETRLVFVPLCSEEFDWN